MHPHGTPYVPSEFSALSFQPALGFNVPAAMPYDE